MAGKKTVPDKEFLLKEAGRIFDYRHTITASFLSDKYNIDDPDFILFVLSLSLLLDEGHIRISLENIKNELEKYFILNARMQSSLTDLLVNNCGRIKSLLKKYPEVFKDPSSLFRAPFIILDSGLTVTSEKLFTLEKNAVNLIRNFIKESSGSPFRAESPEEAEKTAAAVEKSSGITFEKKQREAVEKSLLLPFFILTGGPGTGKTTTIISIVKAILETGKLRGGKVSIALCAPTGRAANRIEEQLAECGLSDGRIEKPQTLHRLLNLSSRGKHSGKEKYLPYDVVIADESSMIDLGMMKALFEKLSPDTSLIMAGDADQLPSVESGAVFSDLLSEAGEENHILKKSFVILDKMKRAGSDISNLAAGIKENRFSFSGLNKESDFLIIKPLKEEILYRDLFSLYQNRKSIESVFAVIENNGVLTTTNKGPFGMDSINRKIKEAAGYQNVPYYENMPLMVLKNDYRNMIFNGDRGIVVKKDDIFTAAFKTGNGELRFIPLSLINDWTVSYAQTVHKSQGSEFENVYVIIDSFSERILTKEILYTAVTRAKKKIIIYSDEDTLETAMSRNVYRNSGIRDAMKRKL